MIEEVKDIVGIYKWQYVVFETEFPESSLDSETYSNKIYGILFAAPIANRYICPFYQMAEWVLT